MGLDPVPTLPCAGAKEPGFPAVGKYPGPLPSRERPKARRGPTNRKRAPRRRLGADASYTRRQFSPNRKAGGAAQAFPPRHLPSGRSRESWFRFLSWAGRGGGRPDRGCWNTPPPPPPAPRDERGQGVGRAQPLFAIHPRPGTRLPKNT